MGLFDFLGNKPPYNLTQIRAKAWAAIRAYKEKNFSLAAKLFSEYFDMKGYGYYHELDLEDDGMYCNLMLSQFYSGNYSACKKTCNSLINMGSYVGDAYAFSSMCSYKLNDKSEANRLWELATSRGCELTRDFKNVADVRMEGFN